MNIKVVLAFLLGAISGAVALFCFLVTVGEPESHDVQPVKVVAVQDKQVSCLLSAAEQARDIYNELTIRRGNLGVKMEFQRVSKKELDTEDVRSQKLYALAGSFMEPCIVYEEPVKLDRTVLADIR